MNLPECPATKHLTCPYLPRCIYNKELDDAIAAHGKILAHSGSTANFELSSMTTEPIHSGTDADRKSTRVEPADRKSTPVDSIPNMSTKSRPVFSIMPDDGVSECQKSASAIPASKPRTAPRPPSFEDVEPPKRGSCLRL